MSDFYLLDAEGQPTLDNEAAAIARVQKGLLSPEVHYWKEGMPEWRPLRELTPLTGTIVPARRNQLPEEETVRESISPAKPLIVPSSTAPREQSPNFFLRRELQPWTLLLEIALGLYIVVALFGLWNSSGSVSPPLPDPDAPVPSLSEILMPQLDWILTAGAIILIKQILFFTWLYRCYKNCRGFTANIRFSSDWAVGYFFIPIWNLFRPYQVMQEIWKISTHPYAAQRARDSLLIVAWWTLSLSEWVIVLLLATTAYDQFNTNLMLGCSQAVVSSLITLIIVHLIYRKQKRLTEKFVSAN